MLDEITFDHSTFVDPIQCILCNQYLNRAQSREEMGIMIGVSAECSCDDDGKTTTRNDIEVQNGSGGLKGKYNTCLLVPTTHHEVNHFISVECFWVAENTKSSKPPINSVKSQVSSEMVHEVIFVLWWCQTRLPHRNKPLAFPSSWM